MYVVLIYCTLYNTNESDVFVDCNMSHHRYQYVLHIPYRLVHFYQFIIRFSWHIYENIHRVFRVFSVQSKY